MAKRKTRAKTVSTGSQAIVVFWLVFIVVIISVFMLNAPTIKRNFNLFKTRLTLPAGGQEEILPAGEEEPAEVVVEPHPPRRTETPAQTQTNEQPPAAQTQRDTPQTQQRPPPSPPQTRDRAIYFTQVNNDGQILQTRVTRSMPVSQSPMQDALNAMLTGPNSSEMTGNMLSFIPRNTRLLSATVRGNTAYLNFSEDFLFNTFGVEGYVAQLRQIVWTVTEFQNVNDVQVLIEGSRMDYLGEGIWIGSPINRQSF
ncbi:MAG: GerMN domain-containing protein [Treponema sp.]|nr:GerMN domain-containing protein [Treponema sp.]